MTGANSVARGANQGGVIARLENRRSCHRLCICMAWMRRQLELCRQCRSLFLPCINLTNWKFLKVFGSFLQEATKKTGRPAALHNGFIDCMVSSGRNSLVPR
jgi:hypothetical protein